MKTGTLFLPGFHLPTLRRKPRSAAQKLAEERVRIRRHTISQLGECFGPFIPVHELGNEPGGDFSRRRIFSKENTFWGFFTQVLDADGGCQEVVCKVQAFAATRSMAVPSASTSAYCQARGKLGRSGLEHILNHTSERLQQRGRSRWWKDRRVVVVDGTGVSMPDTPANQEAWPQPGSQKPGTIGVRPLLFAIVPIEGLAGILESLSLFEQLGYRFSLCRRISKQESSPAFNGLNLGLSIALTGCLIAPQILPKSQVVDPVIATFVHYVKIGFDGAAEPKVQSTGNACFT